MNALRYSWVDEAARVGVPDVIAELGLQQRRNAFGPCPLCGAEHRDGRRPAVGIGPAGQGWHCWKCNAKGSAIQLVACQLLGRSIKAGDPGWKDVRGWFAGRGWCTGVGGTIDQKVAPKRPVTHPTPPPPRPEGVVGLLRACQMPHCTEQGIIEWLRGRGYDPTNLPAGILPRSHPWPKWWPYESDWYMERAGHDTRGVYRLVVPAFGPDGTLLSMHARAVVGREEMIRRGLVRTKTNGDIEEEKTRWPAGCSSAGLLFADPWRARRLLRGQFMGPLRLVFCEGITDYLAACSHFRTFDDVAIFGGTEGSWSALSSLPKFDGARAYIATDPDRAGERFATTIQEACWPMRCYRVPLGGLLA